MTGQFPKIMTAVCLVAALAVGSAATFAQTPTDKEISELIAREKFIKKQFEQLKTKMLELADLYDKTSVLAGLAEAEQQRQKDSARILRLAVAQAQSAMIAQKMDSVARHLKNKDEASAALDAKELVIKELQKVLDTLRFGLGDLDKRYERLKQWQELLAKVDDMIAKQKDLELKSRLNSERDTNDKQMADFAQRMKGLIAAQKDLLAKTGKLDKADPNVGKLSDLRDAVRGLIDKQTKIQSATPMTPVAELSVPAKAQKDLAGKTEKVGQAAKDAQKDDKLGKALAKAGADPKAAEKAAEALGQAAGEMKKASSALQRSSKSGAAKPQEQALADLKTAEKALSNAIAAMSKGTKPGDMARKQDDLGAKTDQLAKDVQKAADNAGMQSKAGDMSKAAGEMSKASDRLTSQDPKGAQKHQKEALKHLEKKADELADLRRRIEKEARKPTEPQAKEQAELASQASQTAQEMKNSESPTPGQSSMQKASQSMAKAAGQLSQGKSDKANPEQKKALDELQKTRDELAKEIQREEDIAQAEALAKIDAMLEKVLKTQKTLSSGTVAVFKLKTDKGYARPEELSLRNELADGEGKLADDVEKIRKMLDKEGTTVVFPAVLKEVQQDLGNVQRRLASLDAGDFTQSIQREVERTLQEMIDSIRKELSRRRKKGGGGGGGGKGGGGKKPPLVPPVAELKLLRILQLGINNRTISLADAKAKAAMGKDEISKQHKLLSGREDKLKGMALKIAKEMTKMRMSQ